jgi:hypothetical protein
MYNEFGKRLKIPGGKYAYKEGTCCGQHVKANSLEPIEVEEETSTFKTGTVL